MVSKALDIMEAWVKACPKPGLKGLSAEKPLQPVPRWMDALLLLVHSCTAIIWKEATPDAPADKPKATEPQVRPLKVFLSRPAVRLPKELSRGLLTNHHQTSQRTDRSKQCLLLAVEVSACGDAWQASR